MKKLLSLIAALAVLAVAGSASAATFEVNMYGATAQIDFWESAAGPFLENDLNCASSNTLSGPGDSMISKGTGCNTAAAGVTGGSASDIVYIRYSGAGSRTGFTALCGQASECPNGDEYELIAKSEVDNPDGAIDTFECARIGVAISDVRPDAFTQQTEGFDFKDINKGNSSPTSEVNGPFNFCDELIDTNETFLGAPIIVPFAFMINNAVDYATCDDVYADVAPANDPALHHLAYDPKGALCDYDLADGGDAAQEACIGYYKCNDESESDSSLSGGEQTGQCDAPYVQDCDSPFDCPYPAELDSGEWVADVSQTSCTIKPLDNVNRFMALKLFDGTADNWRDFGPAFPDVSTRVCSRQAGSGTLATLDKAVLRGDVKLKLSDNIFPSNYLAGDYQDPAFDQVAMYAQSSSSTHLTDCVNDTPYAIGFADVDKLAKGDHYNNVHYAKYQGVYPNAASIANGDYTFWAQQVIGYRASKICGTPGDLDCGNADVAQGLIDFASVQSNLETYLPNKAKFWVTRNSMNVEKAKDASFATFK